MRPYATRSRSGKTIKDVKSRRHLQWLAEQIRLVDEEIDLLTREKDDLYGEADELMARLYR